MSCFFVKLLPSYHLSCIKRDKMTTNLAFKTTKSASKSNLLLFSCFLSFHIDCRTDPTIFVCITWVHSLQPDRPNPGQDIAGYFSVRDPSHRTMLRRERFVFHLNWGFRRNLSHFLQWIWGRRVVCTGWGVVWVEGKPAAGGDQLLPCFVCWTEPETLPLWPLDSFLPPPEHEDVFLFAAKIFCSVLLWCRNRHFLESRFLF